MIKTAGNFKIHVGKPYSWFSWDVEIEHLTLSEEDLYDLKYLFDRAVKIFKDKKEEEK